jgi:hypothetical protein
VSYQDEALQSDRRHRRVDCGCIRFRRVVAIRSERRIAHPRQIDGHGAARLAEMFELLFPLRRIGAVAVNEDNRQSAAAAVVDVDRSIRRRHRTGNRRVCTARQYYRHQRNRQRFHQDSLSEAFRSGQPRCFTSSNVINEFA